MRGHLFSILIPLFVILLTGPCIAQTSLKDSAYVSVHAGAFVSSLEGFHNTYGSAPAFDFGGGFAIQLFKHIGVCADATYLSKNGTYNWPLPDQPGPAYYRQWTLTGGLQYDLRLSSVYRLDFSGGVAYISASEEFRTRSGTLYGGASGPRPGIFTGAASSLGYFAGAAIGRRFELTPLVLFVAGRYTFAPMTMIRYEGNYGGFTMTAGIRYLFAL